MHHLDDITRLPDDFDGRVRLFPLPELVMFPHAMQPLHIFEPRYCEMLLESLDSDRLIAIATLDSRCVSWTSINPPIASQICIGRIVTHAELEHDRHNILLVGAKRARIIRETDTGRPFRIAEVQVATDIYPPCGAGHRQQLKRKLLEAFGNVVPSSPSAKENLQELMAGQMGLGPITDIISYTMPFDTDDKLRLLDVDNVDARAEQLVELLNSGKAQLKGNSQDNGTDDSEDFPPRFSTN